MTLTLDDDGLAELAGLAEQLGLLRLGAVGLDHPGFEPARASLAEYLDRGAEGAITYDGSELAQIPPHRVHAVDSNGAGDMFAGAFLYAITRGEAFPVAGRFASLAAGRVVANYGPRLPAADYPDLRADFFGD